MTPGKSKEAECLKCGWVGKLIAHIPLRWASCPHCRALGWDLRLYREKIALRDRACSPWLKQ